MILRVWRGWTVADRADVYEALLRETVFPSILARDMPGFRRIALYRRPLDAEVEFMTVMAFDSAEAVAAFMGKADTAAYVPDEARPPPALRGACGPFRAARGAPGRITRAAPLLTGTRSATG